MFCSKCGAEIPEGTQWCPQCGTRQGTATPAENPVVNTPQTAPGAIAGFILSLAGLLLDWVPIAGLALSIVGTVICGKGKKEMAAKPGNYTNTGMLTAGHILGIIGIIGGAIYLMFWLISVVILGGSSMMLFDFLKDMN